MEQQPKPTQHHPQERTNSAPKGNVDSDDSVGIPTAGRSEALKPHLRGTFGKGTWALACGKKDSYVAFDNAERCKSKRRNQ